ncbi:hypothetical protein [Algoriphagus aquimarinus]|uniref:DUF3060 domain-containing protein n=1 Tax=Algoriphagus aquimarinus TaxID=237018 RepID=A0A5C7A9J4_9BACT|nr:hypothetical protein [Algoriphagus aquimarinus]TXE03733.1 hypothetical protein ESV85_19805 [Algoriphagus aquimarinus]
MKILVILFFAMLSSGLYAQSVIVNPDGTHSVVIDHGVHKVIVNPNGTHSVAVSSGTSNIIVNPDGTHSQIIGNGNSKIIVNPNGTHSILTTQGNFQRVIANPNSGSQPFFFKKRGSKMIILRDGSILHFKKVKQKRKSRTKTIRHL